LDLQIVWRKQNRPLKNPLKIVNAMSFGIPTIAYPETAFREVDGYYWQARTMNDVAFGIERLRQGFDAKPLMDKAEYYHISRIGRMYKCLL
jgi:hypothetical protein